MLEVRSAKQRGSAQLDWLLSYHSFSFGHYYDAKHMGFSDLRVINEDVVQPGKGFGTHPHQDMEIFTYVISGALEHKDSMGTGSIIKPGDVQMMSAGSGITHSEFNPSATELVHLLQIWIIPNKKSVKPRYQQQHFTQAEKQGRLRLIISPEGADNALSVYQDVNVYAGCFDADQKAQLTFSQPRYVYIQIVRGTLTVNNTVLQAGDGARIRDENQITFQHGQDAEVLVFDLRPQD